MQIKVKSINIKEIDMNRPLNKTSFICNEDIDLTFASKKGYNTYEC